MMSTIEFARAVWLIGDEVRALGWVKPDFQATPSGQRRLRRADQGVPIVVVVTRGKSIDAVINDLIDGVIAVNFPNSVGRDVAEARDVLAERVFNRHDISGMVAA
jgi:hypothetical protein